MDSSDVTSFDDPALKSAIRRTCGGENASADFRERLARTIATADDDKPIVPAPTFRRDRKPTLFIFGGNTTAALAIAAAFLVVVGIAAVRLMHMSREELPRSLGLAMVARHDICRRDPDHQDHSLPQVAFAALGPVLQTQLGHPVLAANLMKDGWVFRGVSKCPVGDVRSAHFLFAKGDETLSVFSLPSNAFPTADKGPVYESVVENHPIVCYAKDGAVFGFVGHADHGELKLAELESLVKRHEGDVTLAAAFPLKPQYAELLHDRR